MPQPEGTMTPVAELLHKRQRFGLFRMHRGEKRWFQVFGRGEVTRRETLVDGNGHRCEVIYPSWLWKPLGREELPESVVCHFDQLLIQGKAANTQEPPPCP